MKLVNLYHLDIKVTYQAKGIPEKDNIILQQQCYVNRQYKLLAIHQSLSNHEKNTKLLKTNAVYTLLLFKTLFYFRKVTSKSELMRTDTLYTMLFIIGF